LLKPSWDFDILEFNERVHNNVLVPLLIDIIQQNQLDKRFNIPARELYNFANLVQDGYIPNMYHNAIHGASVMYDMNWFMCQEGVKHRLSSLDLLAGIFSAAVHGRLLLFVSK
jgi:hypothetical protein